MATYLFSHILSIFVKLCYLPTTTNAAKFPPKNEYSLLRISQIEADENYENLNEKRKDPVSRQIKLLSVVQRE